MCGIAGILVKHPERLQPWLEAAAGGMKHRGPDDWAICGRTDRRSMPGRRPAARQRLEPDAEIHAFAYAPQGFEFNEEKWARLVAEKSGVQQHFIDFTGAEMAAELDRLLEFQEEPFGSSGIYAQNRIFRRAREQGVVVMLDGQGGDEILAGYPIYFGAKLAGMARTRRMEAALESVAQPPRSRRRAPLRMVHGRGAFAAGVARECRAQTGAEGTLPAVLAARLVHRAQRQARPTRAALDKNGVRGVLIDTLPRTNLPQLLHFEDRNSMAYSVESRVPFLNTDIVEFALSLPEEYLISDDGITKKVFKEAMRGLVPDEILNRTDKVGFHTPSTLLLREGRPWVEEIVSAMPESATDFVNPDALRRQWRRVLAGKTGNDHGFWRVLCFLRWMQLTGG